LNRRTQTVYKTFVYTHTHLHR